MPLELLPAAAPPNAFDNNLFFERRSASLALSRWNERGSWCTPRPELVALLKMYAFWALVWGGKVGFGGALLLLGGAGRGH